MVNITLVDTLIINEYHTYWISKFQTQNANERTNPLTWVKNLYEMLSIWARETEHQ
jgi:hypothetical protein